ncbi:MAG: ATP-binding cassette domain-containing protein [Oscillospiraceae bacterium]|jgi:ABC-2 type transport system ATP-binding protein
MLSVNAVSKKFGNFSVLEDITLDFENGVYGLLAPNGAGKTTLIKMMMTLLFPTQGVIMWDGVDIRTLDADYRDVIGYLPQDFGYYKGYTPRQYLNYLAALKAIPKEITKERIETLLDMVGLSDVAGKKMRKFSGGMLQRVGIAQAMLGDPKLLVLDEPTAGLDPKERVRFRNIIHSLAKDRIVILSTHIVSDIETIANKIIMLRDHKVYCCKSPAEICSVLDGKLFEMLAGSALKDGDYLLSERQDGNGTRLRFISEAPGEEAEPVKANLEDVFLYVYRDEKVGL